MRFLWRNQRSVIRQRNYENESFCQMCSVSVNPRRAINRCNYENVCFGWMCSVNENPYETKNTRC